jgi:putative inorganic carbon (HCO3(-)) transporter
MTATERTTPLERAAYYSLLAFAAMPQFSIAAAQILLGLTALLWLILVISRRERIEVPFMFWPLTAYALATLVSSYFSIDPRASFWDSRQLLLFMIVPIAYRLLPGERSLKAIDVIITVGALHAIYGIVQYGVMGDDINQRVRGVLGHYMTYSGVIMLAACTAAARVMFRQEDRVWSAIVMPALLVALALTLSRNAWVGACAGIGTLLLLRDFRLIGLLPVAVGVFIALAPATMTDRLYSTFSLETLRPSDTSQATVQSNRDRIAMIRSGFRMVRDYPLTGVGPDMVIQVYPHYRDPEAIRQLNPHLHNVPLQIAAERGLPALAMWLWFVVVLIRDFVRLRRNTAFPFVPTAGLAVVVAMLAAGMFEHNFHDSEFLMLFLLLVTLPYAADSAPLPTRAGAEQVRAA